jgi:predicted TIM-barrel fold metal-dependent hydrolase
MGALPFVDAHIHLWDLDAPPLSLADAAVRRQGPNGSVEAIAHTYLLDDYLADAKAWNVVGAVHVDAGAEAPRR